jgi:integrase
LDWWKEKLGPYYIAAITGPRISDCLRRLEDEGVAPSTINRYIAILSHAYTKAKEWGWVVYSPMGMVKKREETAGRVRYLERDEIQRLLGVCREISEDAHRYRSGDKHLYVTVFASLCTGMRKGEVLGLRHADVNLKRRVLRIPAERSKGKKPGEVPIITPLVPVLESHIKIQRLDSPYLFPGRSGRPVAIDRAWKRALKKAEIADFRWHDMRHCTASYLVMAGVDPATAARILRNTPQVADRYIHLSTEFVADQLEKAGEKMF